MQTLFPLGPPLVSIYSLCKRWCCISLHNWMGGKLSWVPHRRRWCSDSASLGGKLSLKLGVKKGFCNTPRLDLYPFTGVHTGQHRKQWSMGSVILGPIQSNQGQIPVKNFSSLFQPIQAYSILFHPNSVYLSLLKPFSTLLQHIQAYSSLFQPILAKSTKVHPSPG